MLLQKTTRWFLIKALSLSLLTVLSPYLAARDRIHIVGSSAVYPFAATVAERFAFQGDAPTPVVESMGTGGGFKIFCSGAGSRFPDIATASRKITPQELAVCKARHIGPLYEIVLGYDGIVLVHSKQEKTFNVTREQLFLALSARVPVGGKLIRNPYRLWKDIHPSLPAKKIHVFGPPATSGTRDVFLELVMEKGCQKIKSNFPGYLNCQRTREDGVYIEIGANENMIIQKVALSSGAVGIVSYSFLEQNKDRVHALSLEGSTPSAYLIQTRKYPVSRPLYVYIKKDNEALIPHLRQFAIELTAPHVSGHSGYLSRRGLIALEEENARLQHETILKGSEILI